MRGISQAMTKSLPKRHRSSAAMIPMSGPWPRIGSRRRVRREEVSSSHGSALRSVTRKVSPNNDARMSAAAKESGLPPTRRRHFGNPILLPSPPMRMAAEAMEVFRRRRAPLSSLDPPFTFFSSPSGRSCTVRFPGHIIYRNTPLLYISLKPSAAARIPVFGKRRRNSAWKYPEVRDG